jgi:hypothetical protein
MKSDKILNEFHLIRSIYPQVTNKDRQTDRQALVLSRDSKCGHQDGEDVKRDFIKFIPLISTLLDKTNK